MDDLISRQAAITLPIMPKEYRKHKPIDCEDAYEKGWCDCQSCIGRLPTAEPTLYGYKIEHLAYIATVMEKEGVTAEYAIRTFDDISRVLKMLIEEVQAKFEEALNNNE